MIPMKKIITAILSVFVLCMLLDACSMHNEDSKAGKATGINTDSVAAAQKDSVEACTQTIKDPNHPKPMALMMRILAANADSMRHELLRGEKPDSLRFPFVHFYLVEPTDPAVLEPQFFENARIFKQAYADVFKHTEDQKKYYNIMINGCIKCHESYCSGPLKRIRKFPIE